MKFELLAITFIDGLVGSQIARGIHKQKHGKQGLIAEMQKKPAIWDPKNALHYFCILYIIFVYSPLFKSSFSDIILKCLIAGGVGICRGLETSEEIDKRGGDRNKRGGLKYAVKSKIMLLRSTMCS